MKKIILILVVALFFVNSCKVQKIGSLNMISTKNIGNFSDYEQLASYARGNQLKITQSKAKTIQGALDQTVKEVPGGVFMMNASLYLVRGKYFAVEGDVWGIKQNADYKGFKVGDKVMWKTVTGYKRGVVEAIKDSENCVVIDEENQKRTTIKYVKLMRVGDVDNGKSEK